MSKKRLYPKPIGHLILLIVWLIVATALTPLQAQEGEMIDEIVAVVDGEIILRSEVDALSLSLLQQQQVEYSEELWPNVLQELIDQKILLSHAKRDTTISVTEDQISQEIESRIQQLSARAGGEQRLEQLYGKSMFQIRDELRDGVRDQLLTNAFQQARLQNVRVTPSEVKAWFNEFPTDSLPTLPEIVRVAHIVKLPEINPEARQEAMDLITTIRDSIMHTDATIEELAKFSDDPGSAQQGGRISNIKLSELVPEFGAVASRLEPGTLSEPFETSFGLHIMRLNSRVGDVIDFNHILIRIDDSNVNMEPARKALEVLRDSLMNSSISFERMAKEHSDEPLSAAQGGFVTDPQSGERDLVLEALGPDWQAALRGIKEGEISRPVETELLDGRKAMHIVLLQKRVPEHVVNLVTDYERIEQLVTQEKRARVRQQWLERLRKDVYIKKLVNEPDSLQEAASRL